MRSKIKFLLLLLLVGQQTYSQRATLNPSLWREIIQQPASTRIVSLLVKGNISIISQQTKLLGGTFKYAVKDIASVSLPIDKVNILQQVQGISRIEGLYGSGKLLDEMTLIN